MDLRPTFCEDGSLKLPARDRSQRISDARSLSNIPLHRPTAVEAPKLHPLFTSLASSGSPLEQTLAECRTRCSHAEASEVVKIRSR